MTDAELGIELYVVVGNALNLLLRGASEQDREHCHVPLNVLSRLDAALAEVQPAAMLATIRALPPADKQALAVICRYGVQLAGSGTSTLLGAPEALVEELARAIETA